MRIIYTTKGGIRHFWSTERHPDYPIKAVLAEDMIAKLQQLQRINSDPVIDIRVENIIKELEEDK